MAFRAPKVLGTFEKRAPGGKVSTESDRKKSDQKSDQDFQCRELGYEYSAILNVPSRLRNER